MFNKIFGFFGYKVIKKTEIESLSRKLVLALSANDSLEAKLALKNEKIFNLDGLEWSGRTVLLSEIDETLKSKFGDDYIARLFKPVEFGKKQLKKVTDLWDVIGERLPVKRRHDWEDANKGQ